ncbi:type II secretion system F family protein [Methylomarinum vadi]|uniref:type II secretion system F family protein n=1 Tax=Methylomarinum vadi TaxID=438855 RepID=UPI0004DFAD9D|nr:type II secretion system F family protein [Methylomarinum vadi]
MPQYQYTAISPSGEQIKGVESANSLDNLSLLLKRRKLILVKAKELKKQPVSFNHTLRLIIELNDLLGSGLVLERALQIIASDSSDPRFSKLCEQIRQQLKSGLSLSQALQQIGSFDSLLIPLIQAGEASGQLTESLAILDHYYQSKKQLRSDIIASMAYPSILVIVSIISLIALALYVIPVFKDIFADNMDNLPLGALISFQVSDWVTANGFWLLIACATLFVVLSLAVKHNDTIRHHWHVLLFKLPLFGNLVSQNEAANTFSVLSVLLKSGVPLVKSMQITQKVLSNEPQQQGMEACIRQLKQGRPLSKAMEHIPYLPTIARRLINVGDESGNLAHSSEKASQIIQRELRNTLKGLVALLEPVIILVMGGVIGFVVISMLLAVFSMSDLV